MPIDPHEILPRYGDWAPTQFDTCGLGADRMGEPGDEGRADWLVAPVTRTRDSDLLEQTNWTIQLAALEAIQEDDYGIFRFSHWGPGWFQIVLVRPGSPCAQEAAKIACALADYPVLDDEAWSMAEEDLRLTELDRLVARVARQDIPSERVCSDDVLEALRNATDTDRSTRQWLEQPEVYSPCERDVALAVFRERAKRDGYARLRFEWDGYDAWMSPAEFSHAHDLWDSDSGDTELLAYYDDSDDSLVATFTWLANDDEFWYHWTVEDGGDPRVFEFLRAWNPQIEVEED